MPSLYDTAAWKRARVEHLALEPLCRHCKALGRVKPAHHVDHMIPHGGNEESFFDENNWQSLCRECHAFKTRRDEGKTVRMGCDIDGVPMDSVHPWNRQG